MARSRLKEKSEHTARKQEASQKGDADLANVRAHIESAVQILRTKGDKFTRMAWLLEDTLVYLTQAQAGEELSNRNDQLVELASSMELLQEGEPARQ